MSLSMRRYPPWWDGDITLYNRDMAADGSITWYPTRLTGCFYTNPKGTGLQGGALRDSDTFICRIPENESYRSPAEWSALDMAGKTSFFTLHTGDIIVPGHVGDSIDEGGKGGLRSAEFLEKYARAGAFRVSGALACTAGGAGSPHYRAEGVV